MAAPTVSSSFRIGVDVGGTNTDAVILDPSNSASINRGVVAWHKTATTSPDVTDGIEAAVKNVLETSKVPPEKVSCITIGTTHFVNAVCEHDARRLSKVAVIRLSTSYTRHIPPFSDFPHVLKEIMNGYCGFVNGGLHIDGSQESPVVRAQVVRECNEVKRRGLNAIVICGVFSPIDTQFKQESQVRKIILEEMPDADVVCSSEVANLGFLERENASILNASILKFARRTIRGFRAAMRRLSINCPLYLTQNDGTLIDAASAARLPIRTFSSGATNSMRGAAYLGSSTTSETFKTSAIVVDIGGTTSDVGVLLPSGYPRQASAFSTVAGIRINYNMPHVESIGLGGGSIILKDSQDNFTVGPKSVGHLLTQKAKVFGGDTLTATDIAVAHNPEVSIGDAAMVKDVDLNTVTRSRSEMKHMLERVIDTMKTSPEALPVLLVGGGSAIAPDNLDGVSTVIRPPFHQVANAVGAAICKVGGTVDIIQSTASQTVAEALEHAKAIAIDNAVKAGAFRDTIEVTEMDSMPLQYVENQIRTIVRVAGDLVLDHSITAGDPEINGDLDEEESCLLEDEIIENLTLHQEIEHNLAIDEYKPKVLINKETHISEWIVSETDLNWLADGCYVLGCAGGGTPHPEFLKLRDQVRNGHIIRIIDASSLSDDATVYWGGNMGSPAVSTERLSGGESIEAVHEMMSYLRQDSFDAVMPLEIGGGNGLQPLSWGSDKNFNRPVVDADWMGRAYPNLWQVTLAVYESNQLVPCSIASGSGKAMLLTRIDSDMEVDRVLRAPCVEMGSLVGLCAKPTTAGRIRDYGVLNTLSSAWRIGRCIARANAKNTTSSVGNQIVDEMGGPTAARVLFRGKMIGVERKLVKGHSYGEVIIEQLVGADEDGGACSMPVASGGILKVPFKNENIYAMHVAENGKEEIIAMVPDLIAILDVQTGKAVGVPEFRYGVIVLVLGITASPRWTDTERGLEIGGPGAFGFDFPYKPLGKYVEPKSVVQEFTQRL